MSRRVLFLRGDKTAVKADGSQMSPEEEAQYLAELEAHEVEEKRKFKMLVISFVLMLVFGLANKVTQILQMDYIENYPLFLSLITTAVYIPVSALYVVPMMKFGTSITPEQRAIPTSLWVKIGALDSIAGIMQVLTINIIRNGTLVVLLSQTAIPISMLCSKYWLGAKYTWAHYIGVLIVIIGLAVVLVPRFVNKKASDDDDDGPSTAKMLIAIAVFVAAGIPQCLSTVVKELALGAQDVDAWYLNLNVAIWQFLISFPLLIPSAFTENVAIKELPQHLFNGAKCWVGINTITNTTTAMASLGLMYYTAQQISTSVSLQRLQQQVNEGKVLTDDEIIATDDIVLQSTATPTTTTDIQQDVYHYPYVNMASPLADSFLKKEFLLQDKVNNNNNMLQAEKKKPDDCAKAPIFVNAYMCANIFYNILIIMLIKYGSAVLFYISMSILLPLSSFAFAMPFMPKPTKLSAFDIIGLIVLLIGLSIYRFYHQIFGKKKTAAEEEEEGLLADGENGNTGMIPSDNNATLAFQQQQQQQQGGNNGNTYMKDMMNANLDDPFGDGADDYAPAEYHPTLEQSINNSAPQKKGKKGRK